MSGGWYCSDCGWTTTKLPSFEVHCARCGRLGLRGFDNARPRKVACPEADCRLSVWEDGDVNPLSYQHRLHAAAPAPAPSLRARNEPVITEQMVDMGDVVPTPPTNINPFASSLRAAGEAGVHETSFVGGYLRCSCGWLTDKLLWNIAAVDAEAARHLAGVEQEVVASAAPPIPVPVAGPTMEQALEALDSAMRAMADGDDDCGGYWAQAREDVVIAARAEASTRIAALTDRVQELETNLVTDSLQVVKDLQAARAAAEVRNAALVEALTAAKRWCEYHYTGEVGAAKAIRRIEEAVTRALSAAAAPALPAASEETTDG